MRFPAILASLLIVSITAGAEDPSAVDPVREFLSKVQQLDSKFRKDAYNFQMVLLQEADARLTSDEWEQLHFDMSWTFSRPLETIGGMHIPSRNAALKEARAQFDPVARAYIKEKDELFASVPPILDEWRKRALTASREELLEMWKDLVTLRFSVSDHPGADAKAGSAIYQANGMIFSRLDQIDIVQSGDPKRMGGLVDRMTGNRNGDPKDPAITTAVAAYRSRLETAEATLCKLIVEGKPVGEMAKALSTLEQACAEFQETQPRLTRDKWKGIPEAYGSIVNAVISAGPAQYGVQSAIQQLKALNPEQANQLEQFFAEKRKSYVAAAEKERAEAIQKIHQQLASASGPFDLQVLASDVQGLQAFRRIQSTEDLDTLEGRLQQLASFWKANKSPTSSLTVKGFEKEMAAIEQKMERDAVAKAMRAPELLQSPLLENPLPDAVDAYCEGLAKAKNWSRLLTCLEARIRAGESTLSNEAGALRAYLLGRNHELAEQWPEAIGYYRAVVATESNRLPIADAAERLRALEKMNSQR